MSRFRVLQTDRAWPDDDLERQILEEAQADLIPAPQTDEATLVSLAKQADAFLVNWAKVTEAVIRSAPRLRIISRTGIGIDNIAVEVATSLGIPVTNIPDYCVSEVADHTLALLLAALRQVAFFHGRTKAGEYRLQAGAPMRRLSGLVLGVVGLGHVGRNLIPKARALGFQILVHTHSGNDYGLGCEMVSFERLIAESDAVTLHLPATPQTRGMFHQGVFARMKRTAWLINTSRGALVNEADLYAALQQNQIAGAALDVFDPEPPDLQNPLFRDERVVITPHAAFVSVESILELRRRTARQVADALLGKRPESIVNPEVWRVQSAGG